MSPDLCVEICWNPGFKAPSWPSWPLSLFSLRSLLGSQTHAGDWRKKTRWRGRRALAKAPTTEPAMETTTLTRRRSPSMLTRIALVSESQILRSVRVLARMRRLTSLCSSMQINSAQTCRVTWRTSTCSNPTLQNVNRSRSIFPRTMTRARARNSRPGIWQTSCEGKRGCLPTAQNSRQCNTKMAPSIQLQTFRVPTASQRFGPSPTPRCP